MTYPSPARPVADEVRLVLDRAATALGTAPASAVIGAAIDEIFAMPAGSAEYGRNGLMPESVPCEISFSENELHTLRFSFELVRGDRPLAWRRRRMTEIAADLVRAAFGEARANWLLASTAPWLREDAPAPRRFSAWMAPVVNAQGLQALKLYYEAHEAHLPHLAGALPDIFDRARTTLPALVPWYVTFRSGPRSSDQRLTVRHAAPLPLADFARLADVLGLGDELRGLEPYIRLAIGDRQELGDREFLFGLGDTARGVELKLELVLGMMPDLDRDAFSRGLERLLGSRPDAVDGLARWLRAFDAGDASTEELTVLSVRMAPGAEPLVNLYLRHPAFSL